MKRVLLVAVAALLVGSVASADDYYIELLKSDVKSMKKEIIIEVMEFTPEQSRAFWPVYKEYQAEVNKVNDAELKLIKKYAENYNDLGDDLARELGNRLIELDLRRGYIKKEYFRKFSFVLSPVVAAKFLQVEHRISLLVELQIASVMPMIGDM
jgi:hypothetical protein